MKNAARHGANTPVKARQAGALAEQREQPLIRELRHRRVESGQRVLRCATYQMPRLLAAL